MDDVLVREKYDRVSDVSMNIAATMVVIFPKNVPAPLLPKTV